MSKMRHSDEKIDLKNQFQTSWTLEQARLLVVPSINPENKITVIYAAPSSESLARDKHFIGALELKLLHIFASAGILRSTLNFINLLDKSRSWVKRGDSYGLHFTESDRFNARHRWEEYAKELSNTLLIPCGQEALDVVLPGQSIAIMEGSNLRHPKFGNKIIPLQNHQGFFTNKSFEQFTYWYAKKIAIESSVDRDLNKEFKHTVTSNCNLLEREFLNPNYQNNPTSMLAVDIECCDTWLTCIGFAKSPNHAYVVPFAMLKGQELVNALKMTARILASKVPKLLQNGKFDIVYLAWYYGMQVNNYTHDTMIAQYSCYTNLPKDLGTLAKIHTHEPNWKHEKGAVKEDG